MGGGAGEPSQRGTPATWKDGVCSRLDSKKQRGCQTKRELYNMYILSFKTFGRARYIIILKAAQAGVSFCLEWVQCHFHECIGCASKSLLYQPSCVILTRCTPSWILLQGPGFEDDGMKVKEQNRKHGHSQLQHMDGCLWRLSGR